MEILKNKTVEAMFNLPLGYVNPDVLELSDFKGIDDIPEGALVVVTSNYSRFVDYFVKNDINVLHISDKYQYEHIEKSFEVNFKGLIDEHQVVLFFGYNLFQLMRNLVTRIYVTEVLVEQTKDIMDINRMIYDLGFQKEISSHYPADEGNKAVNYFIASRSNNK